MHDKCVPTNCDCVKDAVAELRAKLSEALEALKEIADNPCLDPEGNADIAKQAYEKLKRE